MIRVTFINFIVTVWASDIRVSVIERKINETLITKNVSEAGLLLDLHTFVSYNGLRKAANNQVPSKDYRRLYPIYYLPTDNQTRIIILDLLRQTVYATQERMLALEPILRKHENDPALRMAFIYNRLKQLIIDLRRLYTLMSVNTKEKKNPVYQYIYWYSHMVRKYFDMLYIVEHVIDLFGKYLKTLNSKQPEH